MSSGIDVDSSSVRAFLELKSRREVNTVIYLIDDTSDAVVPGLHGNLTLDELQQALPADEPRLIVYDLTFAAADGARRKEIVLIEWMPGAAVPRARAAYAAASTALRGTLDEIHVRIPATELSELEYRHLVARAV
ncbi:hypothetical protein J7E97_22880 [Streptomyces sp. ISL-66]|uniref:cofilin family protein n=1 Tax=Streptomyces sp. ISL-66 TaxID=2819186 RepID=UPI001BE5825D|nr:cofilin family protein [Streptomyces sp. ISL-66]MBT2470632.1 hypothetical protein [Streptomyces sp. ISL-66]